MKSPLAVFMVLVLVAIKAMAASETLHEAVCDHQHGQHEEQREDRPQHDCVVKLFSQGMVDITESGTPLPPISRTTDFVPSVPERACVADLTGLPCGRAPPVSPA